MSQIIPTKGNLAWEYNPFRNYRLTKPKYYFRGKFFSKEELELELDPTGLTKIPDKIPEDTKTKIWENFTQKYLKNGITPYENDPIFYDEGQLVDFDTDEFNFDFNHPVDILPQYSYDGSVNLILNDGKNPPKLINSRFSPLGRNQYQIVDRKGDNDSNIYDQGEQFTSDTSLYKTYIDIPKIIFRNVYQGGNLPVGNYHFYFRYVDADGNETDFIGESGLISIFKGNTLRSINSGFREEDSNKSVKFLIKNIDPAYQYINVYYTKSTSDIDENAVVSAYKIEQKFSVNNSLECWIHITGNEPKTQITTSDINPIYLIADQVQTQEQCQNRLFFGNIHTQDIDYTELQDLSLRFTLKPDTSKEYNPVPYSYEVPVSDTYSDPKFIYNYTGYQNHEIYRFGIVYIMQNGTLSPVFNIRGKYFKSDLDSYVDLPIKKSDGSRNYIISDENTGIIYYESTEDGNTDQHLDATGTLENVYGVLRIDIGSKNEFKNVIGIGIDIQDKKILYNELSNLNIKGFFFVRQKRIPLRLCQAFTVGIDNESHIPLPFVNSTILVGTDKKGDKPAQGMYIAERFLAANIITQEFNSRLYWVDEQYVKHCGAICPEYDINSPYYNTLFSGNEYVIEQVTSSQKLNQNVTNDRHFYVDDYTIIDGGGAQLTSRVIGIEDNTKLVILDDKKFSARAGEAETVTEFEYLEKEPESTSTPTQPTNLVRGSFGPYIGFDKYNKAGTLVNIYISDYAEMSIQELFKLRYNDKSPYYAISDRYSISQLNKIERNDLVLYRGDSYICTYTHRLNRNFIDPDTPTNSTIVDYKTWKNNFFIVDGAISQEKDGDSRKIDLINRGDINAVQMGMWITFPVISSSNLNIRAIDKSRPTEVLLGERSFYPYSGTSLTNLPEALCYNKGFNKSLSERYNFEIPNVPAIKNDFTNRIAYSDIHINDAFKNGYRVFQAINYRDYPKTYGQITKLVEFQGSLICVFEHGVALIPVNERTVAGNGVGGDVYINTSNVLPENPKILSNSFGSQWKDSIIKTPKCVYGVDTVAKKIWKATQTSFECISDFKIQDFLNNNITLNERELIPFIGIRNVKSHYNSHKQDIMFTFYDDLYGFEERVWNVCYNELLQKWITFYSWVPSYSENIYNQYFSFNRDTSKYISKLGISNIKSSFPDGIVISNNIISPPSMKAIQSRAAVLPLSPTSQEVGTLSLVNRSLPSGEGVNSFVYFTLERDNQQNYQNFEIRYNKYTIDSEGNKIPETFPFNNQKVLVSEEFMLKDQDRNYDSILILKAPYMDICSELYQRGIKSDNVYTPKITKLPDNKTDWYNNCVVNNTYVICKDDTGKRLLLETPYNDDKLVILLNIKANIIVSCEGENQSIKETFTEGFKNNMEVDGGYYQSTIAVIPEYNKQFLTTDFWKHGKSGIIDIADDIYPTYWYGKQHPFEFEFVVADNPQSHKIFDNLEIISNNAEPESFHYEIIGDCYDFSKDKKNMYIRQEATKELHQYNGSNIVFDNDYYKLNSIHRPLKDSNGNIIQDKYDKSTIFPLYFYRQDTINTIEDQYHLKDDVNTKDFSAMAGAEIVHYKTPDEYRIWNHAKAVDIKEKGRIRGNMSYIEDRWRVQINPINLIQCNENNWKNTNLLERSTIDENKIPIELGQSLYPLPMTSLSSDGIPKNSEDRAITMWDNYSRTESKLKDKWMKVRIRYSGNKLAVIMAIKTLYSISYG